MLKLHTLRAHAGDCFILEFAKNNTKSKYILIDAGPSHVFEDYLEPFLRKHPGIEFELAVATHSDDDHMIGLSDLVGRMYSQGYSRHKIAKIKEFWYNCLEAYLDTDENRKNKAIRALEDPKQFDPEFDKNAKRLFVEFMGLTDEPEFITRSYVSGLGLLKKIDDMEIPINPGFKNEQISLDSTNLTKKFDDHLTLEIIGPFQEQLDKLLDTWIAWLKKEGKKIKPRTLRDTDKDNSIPNRSSIMFLAEADGKTILFTGDGVPEHIIEGLRKRNILTGETMEVDVLKIPHHGSERNSSEEFFKTILAKTYIISGNGKYDNPHANTLIRIAKAAESLGRKITIYITYDSEDVDVSTKGGKNNKKKLEAQLDAFKSECPEDDYDYELRTIASDEDVFTLVLAE